MKIFRFILAVLGMLSLFNIVAHAQSVVEFSASITIIAAWWHAMISMPFDWLKLDLVPIFLRDVIAINVIAISISMRIERSKKRTSLRDISGELVDFEPKSFQDFVKVALIMLLAFVDVCLLVWAIIFAFINIVLNIFGADHPTWLMYTIVGISFLVLTYVQWRAASRERHRPSALAYVFPLFIAAFLVYIITKNYTTVVRYLGIFLLVLALTYIGKDRIDRLLLPHLTPVLNTVGKP